MTASSRYAGLFMADVILFPQGGRPNPQQVRRLLDETAGDSDKLIYIRKFSEKEQWYRLVTTGQVSRCLREGKVVSGPSVDEEGNWCCTLYKLCGGVRVYVSVALHLNSDRSLKCAYVLNVSNRVPS